MPNAQNRQPGGMPLLGLLVDDDPTGAIRLQMTIKQACTGKLSRQLEPMEETLYKCQLTPLLSASNQFTLKISAIAGIDNKLDNLLKQ